MDQQGVPLRSVDRADIPSLSATLMRLAWSHYQSSRYGGFSMNACSTTQCRCSEGYQARLARSIQHHVCLHRIAEPSFAMETCNVFRRDILFWGGWVQVVLHFHWTSTPKFKPHFTRSSSGKITRTNTCSREQRPLPWNVETIAIAFHERVYLPYLPRYVERCSVILYHCTLRASHGSGVPSAGSPTTYHLARRTMCPDPSRNSPGNQRQTLCHGPY